MLTFLLPRCCTMLFFFKFQLIKIKSCTFFWMIPRRLNFICRCFGTLCLFHLRRPMKMEETECSETSEYKIQAPGNYTEESTQHSKHSESLKSRTNAIVLSWIFSSYYINLIWYFNFIVPPKKRLSGMGCKHFRNVKVRCQLKYWITLDNSEHFKSNDCIIN